MNKTSNSTIVETERLELRLWQESDLDNMIRLCGNEEVMKFFPSTLNSEKSKELLDIFIRHQNDHGFVYFATELKENQAFIGFIGIKWQTYKSHFTPCIDIGWRLMPETWGKGYATEGAKACLDYAFNKLEDIEKIYAVCPILNKGSEKVMQRIGMSKVDEFPHPSLADHSPLKQCALYLIEKPDKT